MTRILHVIPGLTGGGAERQLVLLAAVHARRGHDVHIAQLRDEVPADLLNAGVVFHKIRANGNYHPMLFWRLHDIVRRTQPDILQTWLTLPDVLGGVVSRIGRLPWVLSERSEGANYPPSWKHTARIRLAHGCNAIIANSEGGRDYWTSHGIAPQRVHLIPNAVSVPAENPNQSATLPPSFEGRPLVLFAGRLSTEKNPIVLIDALAKALAKSDAVALLCGTGPMEQQMRSRIEGLGMQERIVLAGHRSDVPSLMRRATLCVAISVFEGNPNVVLEAMAVRCPLVVSDIPAYTRLLDANTACIVSGADAERVADGILSVLNDPDGAMRRAALAAGRLENRTPDDIADAHDRVYAQLG